MKCPSKGTIATESIENDWKKTVSDFSVLKRDPLKRKRDGGSEWTLFLTYSLSIPFYFIFSPFSLIDIRETYIWRLLKRTEKTVFSGKPPEKLLCSRELIQMKSTWIRKNSIWNIHSLTMEISKWNRELSFFIIPSMEFENLFVAERNKHF